MDIEEQDEQENLTRPASDFSLTPWETETTR